MKNKNMLLKSEELDSASGGAGGTIEKIKDGLKKIGQKLGIIKTVKGLPQVAKPVVEEELIVGDEDYQPLTMSSDKFESMKSKK